MTISIKKSFSTIAWSSYLACSWTWCIGMFLPALLIRNYGNLVWLVFAIPNILGAAAMPYILKNPEKSAQLIERHKIMCLTFSAITILFQIYFLGWISTLIPPLAILIFATLLILIYILTPEKKQPFTALIIWMFSIFVFIFMIQNTNLINLSAPDFLFNSPNSIIYLIPASFFGFLLCPYLDLTFHKVIKSNTTFDSKIIFTLGFGFMFLLMIMLTFYYAKPVVDFMNNSTSYQNIKPYLFLVIAHMILQAGFTILVHTKCLISEFKPNNKYKIIFAALSIICFILPYFLSGNNVFLNMSIKEIMYHFFMSFYGVIAPSYILYYMIPLGGKYNPSNKNHTFIFLTSVALALIFFGLAFLGVKWNLLWCATVGVMIVILPRLLHRQQKNNAL